MQQKQEPPRGEPIEIQGWPLLDSDYSPDYQLRLGQPQVEMETRISGFERQITVLGAKIQLICSLLFHSAQTMIDCTLQRLPKILFPLLTSRESFARSAPGKSSCCGVDGKEDILGG